MRLVANALASALRAVDPYLQAREGVLVFDYSGSDSVSVSAFLPPSDVSVGFRVGLSQAVEFARDPEHFHSYQVCISCPSLQNLEHLSSNDIIPDILLKTRCTIAQLDLHPSVHAEANQALFASVVRAFTSLDFSIAWKVVQLQARDGVAAHSRVRAIASCPGEPLPDTW